jgi:anti-sigma regulatory factor (Ser/Thr protein kinase)
VASIFKRPHGTAVMLAPLASLAVAYLLVTLAPIDRPLKVGILNVIYLLPPLLAVAGAVAAFTGTRYTERRFWLYLAAALASLLVGELIWSYYEVVRLLDEPPFPSAADLFYLGAYPFYTLALVSMARSSGRLTVTKVRYLLDLLIVMIVSLAGLWLFILKPLYAAFPGVPLAERIVNSIYPVADLLVLFGLLVNMIGFKSGKYRRWEVLISLGIAAAFTGDLLLIFFSTAGLYEATAFWAKTLDLTWMTGYWLFFMAAAYRLAHADFGQQRAIETGASQPVSNWSKIGIPVAVAFIVPWLIYQASRSADFFESFALSLAAVAMPFILLQRTAAVFYLRQAYVHVLTEVTGGRLVIMTDAEIEASLGQPVSEAVPLRSFADLAPARRLIETAMIGSFPGFDRGWDLTVGACEAMSNAIKHAGSGNYRIYRTDESVQVAVRDRGPGIDFTLVPRAVLVHGFSTMESLGTGFTFMLELCDRVALSSSRHGTTVVLEMNYRKGGE